MVQPISMDNIKFDENIYVRKLKTQELGYRTGIPGGGGRYFFISKSCTSYFPPLSDVIKNDHVLLDVIPDHNNEIVLTNYVYHNDKISTNNGTRDEYRLYLNINVDPGGNYFRPDDIVLIIRLNQGGNIFYKLVRFQTSSKDYARINSMLKSKDPVHKSHAMIPLNALAFIANLRKVNIGKKIIPDEIIEEALLEPVYHAPISEEDRYDTTRIMRSRSFRDLVLYFYGYNCAVTEKELFIDYKDFNNLEAAHIFARSAGGGSHPSNGVALERNLHWAFDKGFFTVTFDGTNYYFEVHKDALKIPYLAKKHGQKLLVPEDSRSRPNIDSLNWHKENVFGMFLKTEV